MTTDSKPKLDAGTIIELLAKVALPAAVELLDIFYRNGEVTAEDWSGSLRPKIRTPFDVLVPQRPGTEPAP